MMTVISALSPVLLVVVSQVIANQVFCRGYVSIITSKHSFLPHYDLILLRRVSWKNYCFILTIIMAFRQYLFLFLSGLGPVFLIGLLLHDQLTHSVLVDRKRDQTASNTSTPSSALPYNGGQ